ncbi:MAG: Rid family detoxifying hydrolase [candidate division WOR-3 bacterium]|nr:Rid family detoxifying hydrolase [candidate division WOR-3 bacterium]
MKEEIKLPNLKPIGPYSLAIRVCDWIYISGQIGKDKNGELKGNIEEQTRQAIENIQEILKSINLSLDNVVKTTIFLVNLDDFRKVNEIYEEYFKKPYPARTTVQVSRLPKGALIEIEAIAYVF